MTALPTLPGGVPQADEVAGRCSFAPRCAWRVPRCDDGAPPLIAVSPARSTACIRQHEIAAQMAVARAAVAEVDRARPSASSADGLVVVEDVAKVFGDDGAGGRRVAALKDVSLALGPGESVGLVGESGSGKTTLGRCLLGLERPTSGRIVVDGIDATDHEALSSADRRAVRRTVQMVFQDPYSTLNPARTVGATLAEALTMGAPRPALRATRSRRCSGASGCRRRTRSASRSRCPAASASGWRSRERWPSARA